jgi:hypothetical protein
MYATMSEDSSAGEVTVYMLYDQDLTPNRDINFSDCYYIQACSGDHFASLLYGTHRAKTTKSLQLPL